MGLSFVNTKIRVSVARYDRKGQIANEERRDHNRKVKKEGAHYHILRDGRSYKEVLINKASCSEAKSDDAQVKVQVKEDNNSKEQTHKEPISLMVQGQVCEENLEWLHRSIVGDVAQPMDVDTIFSIVGKYWPSVQQVRPLGKVKFLITFASQEEAA